MHDIRLESVSKSFGDSSVLSGLSLDIMRGEFAVLYGPPASGKTVLMRLLVGLEQPDAGSLWIRGIDLATLRPGDRNIGYVPQSFALFPNKSVRSNIGYPLTVAGSRAPDIKERVEQVADLLDIGELLERTPDQLSGGQKQRVAIARGLVRDTEIYLLDDPLVGLDFKLRERLVDDLRATRSALNATFLYATSDAGEALALGSHIGILAGGEIVEYDSPYSLYERPSRLETMSRLCFPETTQLNGQLHVGGDNARFVTDFGSIDVELGQHPGEGAHIVAVTRAEHIILGHRPEGPGLSGRGVVAMREDLGAEEIVYLNVAGQILTALVRADGIEVADIELGRLVDFHIPAKDVVIFSDQRRVGTGRAGRDEQPIGAQR